MVAIPKYRAPSWLKAAGYLTVFIAPLSVLVSIAIGQHSGSLNLAAWLPVVLLFGLLPIVDYLVGKDVSNPVETEPKETEQAKLASYYPLITLACLPLQLVMLWMALDYFALLSTPGKIGWILSVGVVGGIGAINVAHELIHKPNRLEQWFGGALLSTVCYAGFKVEHLRGHHVHVSTPKDPSSACYGQSLYHFLPRAWAHNMANAWRLEARRLQRFGLSWFHWRNELLWWYGLSATWLTLCVVYGGLSGALFFALQSLVAFTSLEIINYIEHYGLERRKEAGGRYERTDIRHSWNSSYLISNLLLLQLQRHADHHANPRRRYPDLRHFDESPQLPGGYASMFLLALVPPLWFRTINPRVRQYLRK